MIELIKLTARRHQGMIEVWILKQLSLLKVLLEQIRY